jgi:pyruvate formate lyase activating enzyme
MDIQGLQKMTLLDYPGKVACTIFLGGCDLRCPFCHNAPLLSGRLRAQMTQDELLAFLAKRKGLLDGVCLTGGEPLLRPDLEQLLREIKDLGYAMKLDTNGTHPERLRALAKQGLVDYVAMDVKNSPQRYARTVGVPDLDLTAIEQSVAFLLEGTLDYELRTTVVKEFHDEASFRAIGLWLAGAKRYFLQSFVDRDTVLLPGLHPCARDELETFADILRPDIPAVALRGV